MKDQAPRLAQAAATPTRSDAGRRPAHQLLVLQASAGNSAVSSMLSRRRAIPAVQRQDEIEIVVIRDLDEWTSPAGDRFRIGDAHGYSILMKIEDHSDTGVLFLWYNFYDGTTHSGRPADWNFLALGDIGGSGPSQRFSSLGRQLSPAQWRDLWPNPAPRLLQMYESGRIQADDEVIVAAHRGQIATESRQRLDDNEAAVNDLLADTQNITRLDEYAQGLREAAFVRDRLVTGRLEVDRRLSLALQQPYVGLLRREMMAGVSGPQRIAAIQEQERLRQAIAFWEASFPLLTRLRSDQITGTAIRATLQQIRADIRSTRTALVGAPGRRPTLDPWNLAGVRSAVDAGLGPRAGGVVQAEDRSRGRSAIAGAAAATAAGIALLFVPGGIFIDLAIGAALTADAWDEARTVGRAANTGMHAEDGLMTQAQAQGAQFNAILSTVLTVVGAVGSGLRILRVGRAFSATRRAMPMLRLSEQMHVARALSHNGAAIERLGRLLASDTETLRLVQAAVGDLSGDLPRLANALDAVSIGYRGPVREAWKHGLHADALAAISRAGDAEGEALAQLVLRGRGDSEGILRQLLYRERKAARAAGRAAPTSVSGAAELLDDALTVLSEVRTRGFPFGFRDSAMFARFSASVREHARRYGVAASDIRVHGSAMIRRTPGDIDVAVLVDRATFDAYVAQFRQASRYRRVTQLLEREAAAGKIPYNRWGPRGAGPDLGGAVQATVDGTRVQVSLILRGSSFDVGPYLRFP